MAARDPHRPVRQQPHQATPPYAELDLADYGLTPDADVTMDEVIDASTLKAYDALLTGEWGPSEALFASINDVDRRASCVRQLAELAAEKNSWLRTWQRSTRDDATAAIVYAESLAALAWKKRGSATCRYTTDDQLADFHRLLHQAMDAARRAAELATRDPMPWTTMIAAARGLCFPHDRFLPLWREMYARSPLNRRGYDQALQYWCKKWCGSHERMYAFANAAVDESPALAGVRLMAALEESYVEGGHLLSPPWTHRETQHAAELVRDRSAEDWPRARTDRGLAAIAFSRAGRHTAALDMFRLLGNRPGRVPWDWFPRPRAYFLALRRKTCLAVATAR